MIYSLTTKQYFNIVLNKSACNLNDFYSYLNRNLLKIESYKIAETAYRIFKSSFNEKALHLLNKSIQKDYNFDTGCKFTYHFLERLLVRFLNYDIDMIFNQINKLYIKANKIYRSSKTKDIISLYDDFIKIRYRPYEKSFITIIQPSKRSYKRTYICFTKK